MGFLFKYILYMKYLKKYKIFESLNEEEIHSLCKKYNIEGYIINSDGTIDVDSSVDLSYENLTKLPLKFNKVSGYFNCSENELTSLEGSPNEVGGHFNCNSNKLTSLRGAPQLVSGFFSCDKNKLTSLEGAPQNVGGSFLCDYNELTSLKGATKNVYSFSCGYNRLTSLEGGPESVDDSFYCEYNKLMSLKGAPKSVRHFNCNHNELTSLEYLEFKLFRSIDLKNNPIYSIVKNWINNDNKEELIEYFVDLDVIQEGENQPKLIMMRLEAFYEDMGLKMNIDFDKVKKYYEIIR
jgi:hypothetical protein